MSKTSDLLRKVQALAEAGVGGERLNAQKILADLCRKHGISLASLETQERRKCEFPFEETEKQFIQQCIVSTTTAVELGAFQNNTTKNYFFRIALTYAEQMEVEAKIGFYRPIYKRELSSFIAAFVLKNDLGAKAGSGDMKFSLEELVEIQRKMRSMDAHTLHKQLTR